MAQMPRTPALFPRMKVRGRRNKAKLAERRLHRTVYPYVALVLNPDRRSVHCDVLAKWQPGCQRLEVDRVTDGYGRVIPGAKPHAEVRPAPRPEPQFKVEFKVENRMSDRLWDLLTGKVRDDEG